MQNQSPDREKEASEPSRAQAGTAGSLEGRLQGGPPAIKQLRSGGREPEKRCLSPEDPSVLPRGGQFCKVASALASGGFWHGAEKVLIGQHCFSRGASSLLAARSPFPGPGLLSPCPGHPTLPAEPRCPGAVPGAQRVVGGGGCWGPLGRRREASSPHPAGELVLALWPFSHRPVSRAAGTTFVRSPDTPDAPDPEHTLILHPVVVQIPPAAPKRPGGLRFET